MALAALMAAAIGFPAAAMGATATTTVQRLAVASAADRVCHAQRVPAGRGVVTATHRATELQALTVSTRGGRGDWDLAAFDAASGRKLAASASSTPREVVTVFLALGQRVDVQACRRRGASRAISLVLATHPIATSAADRLAGDGGAVRMVRVAVTGAADIERLERIGLDVTHNASGGGVDVVVYGDRLRRRLDATGLPYTTIHRDLIATDRASLQRDAASTRRRFRALPSARTTYRNYEDFGTELKGLADAYPGHVRMVDLGDSLEGRPIEGVEISKDVGRPDDGRPIFLLAGDTHAREWPSGEVSMEFALDMAKTFDAGTDPRVKSLLEKVRVFVFPILNPDGFVVSREAGALTGFDAGDDRPSTATTADAVGDAGAYKRKNCRANTPDTQSVPCALRAPYGVDLNRAYGAYWGGDGSSSDNTTQQYRGTAPFSEPEAQAVRAFGATHQVQTFVTNHTFTDVGRWLRQPGFKIANDDVEDTTPDEVRMKALGDDMAAATGYVSELGYATLGNITGPSDDWLYYAQGTYGYTPELRGDNFHTGYADAVVGEYEGEGAQAGHGLREAFIIAGEYAANPLDHGILRGSAPAASVLRLRKTTTLHTSDDEDGDGTPDKDAVDVPETFDATITVGAGGSYEWHVNPSTRPLAAAPAAFALTCETAAGAVLQTKTVTIGRGEAQTHDFDACTPPADPGSTTTTTTTEPPPAPPATPTTPAATTPAPAVVVGVRASIGRPPVSARRVNSLRRVRVRIGLEGGGLTDVAVRVVEPGGRTALRGALTRLERSGSVTLALRRRLRAGRAYRVVLTARTSDGRALQRVKALTVTP